MSAHESQSVAGLIQLIGGVSPHRIDERKDSGSQEDSAFWCKSAAFSQARQLGDLPKPCVYPKQTSRGNAGSLPLPHCRIDPTLQAFYSATVSQRTCLETLFDALRQTGAVLGLSQASTIQSFETSLMCQHVYRAGVVRLRLPLILA